MEVILGGNRDNDGGIGGVRKRRKLVKDKRKMYKLNEGRHRKEYQKNTTERNRRN